MNNLDEWLQSMDLGQYTDVYRANDLPAQKPRASTATK